MSSVVACIACVVCVVLLASPAEAKKKQRKRASPLNVVVLPFVGKGTGGGDVKEAIELELELVEVVQVSASDTLEADVRKGGRRAFEASALSAMLAKRGVDVLIKGERGPGEKNPDALLVIAYGKDGQPRFFKELALQGEPDAAAATIVDSLRPTLEGWKSARPVRLPIDDVKEIDAGDVFVDDDLAGDKPKKETGGGGGGRLVTRSGGGDDEDDEKGNVLDDPLPPPKKEERIGDRTSVSSKKKSPLDFNDEPVDRSPTTSSKKKKKSRIDDDDSGEVKRVARTEIGEDGRRRTIDDVEDELAEEENEKGNQKLAHTFALSAAFDGGTWHYQFDGAGIGDTTVDAPFYPGGSVLIDAWPISWLGMDAEVGASVVPFKINGGPIVVSPTEFTSIQLRGGGTAKIRYTLKNGIGLGGRAGYRYLGATVESQTVNGGADNLTVVPGYQLHALSVGAEIFVPILIGGHRLEIDVRADGLPATFYAEQPDNPGRTSLAFGWYAQIAARYDVAGGVFFEARGQSTGTSVAYSDQGERKAFVGNTLQQLQGGSVLNLAAGFSVGLGFMF